MMAKTAKGKWWVQKKGYLERVRRRRQYGRRCSAWCRKFPWWYVSKNLAIRIINAEYNSFLLGNGVSSLLPMSRAGWGTPRIASSWIISHVTSPLLFRTTVILRTPGSPGWYLGSFSEFSTQPVPASVLSALFEHDFHAFLPEYLSDGIWRIFWSRYQFYFFMLKLRGNWDLWHTRHTSECCTEGVAPTFTSSVASYERVFVSWRCTVSDIMGECYFSHACLIWYFTWSKSNLTAKWCAPSPPGPDIDTSLVSTWNAFLENKHLVKHTAQAHWCKGTVHNATPSGMCASFAQLKTILIKLSGHSLLCLTLLLPQAQAEQHVPSSTRKEYKIQASKTSRWRMALTIALKIPGLSQWPFYFRVVCYMVLVILHRNNASDKYTSSIIEPYARNSDHILMASQLSIIPYGSLY